MDLTVVVPTRDEEDNVEPLVERARATLAPLGLQWELVFVDDSEDATPDRVDQAGRRGHPVRLIHRLPAERKDGLSGAVLQGFTHANGSEVVAVMDGDLQHPPELLADLVRAVREGGADVAVASRHLAGTLPHGGPQEWWRRAVSRGARSLVRLLFPRLRALSDPLAGFFAVRRGVIDGVAMRPQGFKILLEVLVRGRWSTLTEVPFQLAPRPHGASKAHLEQGVAFGRHLARLLTRPR